MVNNILFDCQLLQNVPSPLCGHELPLSRSRGYKAKCLSCGSFWDLDTFTAGPNYDASYPILRSHYNPKVGENKVKTLQSWLKKLGINLSTLTVCEVGFGGGHCLKFLMEISGNVFGIETIAENIEHARSLGLEMDRLFFAHALPSELPSRIDLWLFQDSFEHLADPAAFFDWLSKNSSEQAQLLIVLPEAGSISERLLGRFWPHKLNDHRFHWSRKGLIGFLSVRKFNVSTFFRPVKYISLATIVAHIMQKMVTPKGLSEWIERAHSFDLRFHFNIGEMGILLRKNR